MADIYIESGLSRPWTYKALATREGLAWWTDDTRGKATSAGCSNSALAPGGFDMKVLELHPSKRVLWQVADGPKEWSGTKVSWELRQDSEYVIVLFTHQGWKEPVEFMHHCSTKRAVFLLSLKSLIETGKDTPDPHDSKIDNWN
jgi:hypothetical protein